MCAMGLYPGTPYDYSRTARGLVFAAGACPLEEAGRVVAPGPRGAGGPGGEDHDLRRCGGARGPPAGVGHHGGAPRGGHRARPLASRCWATRSSLSRSRESRSPVPALEARGPLATRCQTRLLGCQRFHSPGEAECPHQTGEAAVPASPVCEQLASLRAWNTRASRASWGANAARLEVSCRGFSNVYVSASVPAR